MLQSVCTHPYCFLSQPCLLKQKKRGKGGRKGWADLLLQAVSVCKYLYVYVCGYVEVDFYICFSVCSNTYARTDTCVGVHLYNSVRKYYWHFCFSLFFFFFVPPCRVSIIHHRVHCCERRRESKSQIGAKRVYSCNCGMEGFSSIVIDGTSVEKIGNGMRVSFFSLLL